MSNKVTRMAAERKPVKGILKQSSSFDKAGQHDVSGNKQAKWDEMNILATYHPQDKDYGHDKIDEPPTPYQAMEAEELDDNASDEPSLDPQCLADRLASTDEAKVFSPPADESSDEDETETEEQRAKRKLFEQKRKLHYNEFQAVKLARQLLEEEDDDEGEDGEKEQAEEEPSGVKADSST